MMQHTQYMQPAAADPHGFSHPTSVGEARSSKRTARLIADRGEFLGRRRVTGSDCAAQRFVSESNSIAPTPGLEEVRPLLAPGKNQEPDDATALPVLLRARSGQAPRLCRGQLCRTFRQRSHRRNLSAALLDDRALANTRHTLGCMEPDVREQA